jgi:hypothetical protein
LEVARAGVGGIDMGIRLNLRFKSAHLVGSLRWFLRVRNALAGLEHERKVLLLANGRPAPCFSGIFFLRTHHTTPCTRGPIVVTTTVWRAAMPKAPALALATESQQHIERNCSLVVIL